MNLFWMMLFAALSSSGTLCGESFIEINFRLKQCLEHCWGVDCHTSEFICRYFKSSLEKTHGCLLVDDFVRKSVKLNIQFPIDKELSCLCPHDGVIQATKFHPVVFESPYVRVLAGRAEPGEREPFHTHTWKSLLVVFEDATYWVESGDASSELLHLQAGVYELPPEDLYACTNLGTARENCLRFEVKD